MKVINEFCVNGKGYVTLQVGKNVSVVTKGEYRWMVEREK